MTAPSASSERLVDIAIIGAGPAGLTAGLYAVRTGRSVALLEQMAPGGQAATTWQVDNYPGLPHVNGAELMMKIETQTRDLGLSAEMGSVTGIVPGPPHRIQLSDGELKAKTVIIASGAKPKYLNIPGEQEYRGRGVSYCGTCDGPFFKGVPVAVVGGGNTALEEADYLTRFASKVYLIHRREQFRADKIIQDHVLKNPKIETITPYVPQDVLGDDKGVTMLRINPRGEPVCRDLEVKGVFVFVGWTPQTEAFTQTLDHTPEGFLKTDPFLMTSVPGIFAAGDCRDNALKQIIVAAGEGATAAVMADRHIQTNP